jgi:hypothetical protein
MPAVFKTSSNIYLNQSHIRAPDAGFQRFLDGQMPGPHPAVLKTIEKGLFKKITRIVSGRLGIFYPPKSRRFCGYRRSTPTGLLVNY